MKNLMLTSFFITDFIFVTRFIFKNQGAEISTRGMGVGAGQL